MVYIISTNDNKFLSVDLAFCEGYTCLYKGFHVAFSEHRILHVSVAFLDHRIFYDVMNSILCGVICI